MQKVVFRSHIVLYIDSRRSFHIQLPTTQVF